ncbi:hypothetical protein [Altericroceibacterium xinjiangense]|uniref:hypothetical protein n=1 Tax=Altericroceibacterium xinjiangense TaxID=762261 RepID=UPI000F7EBAF5|nr:hypothetical protein [Altericroceibacterium xinjiangense]
MNTKLVTGSNANYVSISKDLQKLQMDGPYSAESNDPLADFMLGDHSKVFAANVAYNRLQIQTEQTQVRLVELAEKLDDMGECLAAVHVSMAAEQLANRVLKFEGCH